MKQIEGYNIDEYNAWLKIGVKCRACGKKMKPYIPTKGKYKGKWSGYEWTCKCMPNLIMSIG